MKKILIAVLLPAIAAFVIVMAAQHYPKVSDKCNHEWDTPDTRTALHTIN